MPSGMGGQYGPGQHSGPVGGLQSAAAQRHGASVAKSAIGVRSEIFIAARLKFDDPRKETVMQALLLKRGKCKPKHAYVAAILCSPLKSSEPELTKLKPDSRAECPPILNRV